MIREILLTCSFSILSLIIFTSSNVFVNLFYECIRNCINRNLVVNSSTNFLIGYLTWIGYLTIQEWTAQLLNNATWLNVSEMSVCSLYCLAASVLTMTAMTEWQNVCIWIYLRYWFCDVWDILWYVNKVLKRIDIY